MLSFLKLEDGRNNQPALYVAAQVNSFWASISLDSLWADISLRAWYGVLGLKFHKTVCECDTDSESALHHFRGAQRFNQLYAPRVRRMFLSFRQGTLDVCPCMLEQLSSFRSFNLCNLTVLNIEMNPTTLRLAFMQKFLRPGLKTCTFTICRGLVIRRATTKSEHKAAFAVLRAMPDVTHFCLERGMTDDLYSELVEILRDKPALVEVVMTPYALSPENVVKLAQNTSLKMIHSTQDRKDSRTPRMWTARSVAVWNSWLVLPLCRPAPFYAPPFSSLTHVTICTSIENVSLVLDNGFDRNALTSIGILLAELTHPEEVLSLTQTVSRRYLHLKEFRLVVPETEKDRWITRTPALFWSCLRPLCACANIEELEIFWDTAVIVSQEEIYELASSWPDLKRLFLGGKHITSEEKAATLSLDCLVPLAKHCTSLRELFLHTSLRVSEEALLQQIAHRQHTSSKMFPAMTTAVFHLGLPLPPIEQVPSIAAFLDAAFPEPCEVSCPYLTKTLRGADILKVLDSVTDVSNIEQGRNDIKHSWQAVVATLSEV